MVSPVVYRITLPKNWRCHNVLHVSRMRPWYDKSTGLLITEPAELPPPPLPPHDDQPGDV